IARRIFDPQCKKTFATVSALLGPREMSALSTRLRIASLTDDRVAPRDDPVPATRFVRPVLLCGRQEIHAEKFFPSRISASIQMLVHKVEMVEACRGGTLRLRDSPSGKSTAVCDVRVVLPDDQVHWVRIRASSDLMIRMFRIN